MFEFQNIANDFVFLMLKFTVFRATKFNFVFVFRKTTVLYADSNSHRILFEEKSLNLD